MRRGGQGAWCSPFWRSCHGRKGRTSVKLSVTGYLPASHAVPLDTRGRRAGGRRRDGETRVRRAHSMHATTALSAWARTSCPGSGSSTSGGPPRRWAASPGWPQSRMGGPAPALAREARNAPRKTSSRSPPTSAPCARPCAPPPAGYVLRRVPRHARPGVSGTPGGRVSQAGEGANTKQAARARGTHPCPASCPSPPRAHDWTRLSGGGRRSHR